MMCLLAGVRGELPDRKPDPRIMHSCPEAHRSGMAGSQIVVAIMENNLLVELEEVCYNEGS